MGSSIPIVPKLIMGTPPPSPPSGAVPSAQVWRSGCVKPWARVRAEFQQRAHDCTGGESAVPWMQVRARGQGPRILFTAQPQGAASQHNARGVPDHSQNDG